MEGHPAPFREFDPSPTPGGGRRFIVAAVLTLGILVSVVVGVLYWMRSTAHGGYSGPPELTYPENRPYR